MFRRRILLFVLLLFTFPLSGSGQSSVPAPDELFGFRPGADYKIATYSQVSEYVQLLAEQSNRVLISEIGTSALGRPLYVLFISSPENLFQARGIPTDK